MGAEKTTSRHTIASALHARTSQQSVELVVVVVDFPACFGATPVNLRLPVKVEKKLHKFFMMNSLLLLRSRLLSLKGNKR